MTDGEHGIVDMYPLTSAQGGMLYHTLAAPGSGVYVAQYACEIMGNFDPQQCRADWSKAFERHAVLRTAVLWEGLDEPLQVVHDQVEVPWTDRDWCEFSSEDNARRFEVLLQEDRARGFDLATPPLARLALIRTGHDRYRFLWTFHHILADGWSAVTLLEEVFAPAGSRSSLPPRVRPFRDFVAWLREQDPAPAESFWRGRLAGINAPTQLPIGKRTTPLLRYRRGSVQTVRQLSELETEAVRAFARTNRLTLNTLAHGAWALTLGRYSDEGDVVYGATVAGRPPSLLGVDSMIGLFINTIPVRVRVNDDAVVVEWLKHLQDDLLAARSHEHTPLESIAEWTGVGATRAPFESILVFENSPLGQRNPAEAAAWQLHDARYLDQSHYPFALLVFPEKRLRLIAVYDGDRFAAEEVDRLLLHIHAALTGFVANGGSTLAVLPPPDSTERARLLACGTGPEAPAAPDVLDCFDEHVTRSPDAPAVVWTGGSLTYAQLAQGARATAQHIRRAGVSPGDGVAIASIRSPAMLQGILGVLRAGAAYVPIDPTHPWARQRFVIEDSGARLLLTDSPELFSDCPVSVVRLDRVPEQVTLHSTDAPARTRPPGALAYVLYTSGSMGRPKGVEVSRDNLAYSTASRTVMYPEPPRRFLLLSPFTFDSSIVGIFWTLASGGTIVLPRDGAERDPRALGELVRSHDVTHTLCLPALWELVLEQVPPSDLVSLTTVIVAGEASPPSLIGQHAAGAPQARLHNEYGPTETTVWCTVFPVPPGFDGASVPVGRPISGSRIYLLDRRKCLVPEGVPGEIHVAGPGVARGYVNLVEESAERFLPDPYGDGGRMYCTGDLGRWSADGNLLFLGRNDRQIKVGGHRIEPAEVEAVLLGHPNVREVAVGLSSDSDKAAAALVAYVVPKTGDATAASELRDAIRAELPDFMVPSAFVDLPNLPRGSSGKVDRDRLPAPQSVLSSMDRAIVPPGTETEKALARIWEEVLDIAYLGINDHFFEVGGHSLLAIRLLGKIRESFSADLTMEELFAAPTIAALGARLDALLWVRDRAAGNDGPVEEFEV